MTDHSRSPDYNNFAGMPVTRVSNEEALILVALATFRPFTRSDWDMYAGCESIYPAICEDAVLYEKHYTIVLDGEVFNITQHGDHGRGSMFALHNTYEE
jgi:hypothetical protein